MRFNQSNDIPWTFKTWIEKFKDVDLPIGDLAKNVLEILDFPKEDYFDEIYEVISKEIKHPDAPETFALVWSFYQATK